MVKLGIRITPYNRNKAGVWGPTRYIAKLKKKTPESVCRCSMALEYILYKTVLSGPQYLCNFTLDSLKDRLSRVGIRPDRDGGAVILPCFRPYRIGLTG